MKRFLLPLFFISSIAFAQSTPDWRPINRVYKNDGVTVGSVGSAGQIKAGHILTTKSFPVGVIGNDKLAFWNLASASDNSGQTSCSSGAAACDLTNSGTVTFTGTDIFGSARVATFNGTTQFLSSTDAFFNPGNGVSFTYGGWFSLTDWTPATNNALISNYPAGGTDAGFIVYVGTTGYIRATMTNTASTDDVLLDATHSFVDGSWHHVAVQFDYASSLLSVFLDGTLATSKSATNMRSVSSPVFRIGATYTTPGAYMTGKAADVFFSRGVVLTAQDIRRLYSTRIDHNKNLIAKRQDWHFKHQHLGTAGNPYQTLPFVWHDPTDANSLFVDFSDMDAADKVDIRMYDLQQ